MWKSQGYREFFTRVPTSPWSLHQQPTEQGAGAAKPKNPGKWTGACATPSWTACPRGPTLAGPVGVAAGTPTPAPVGDPAPRALEHPLRAGVVRGSGSR